MGFYLNIGSGEVDDTFSGKNNVQWNVSVII